MVRGNFVLRDPVIDQSRCIDVTIRDRLGNTFCEDKQRTPSVLVVLSETLG
jgi:hypothetical protein